jgi:hypothetical protein
MIRVATLLALFLLTGAAPADEPKPPVSLEATVVPGGVNGGFRFPARLQVRLVGEAKESAVVTEGLSAKVAQGDKKVKVSLALPEVKDDKGRLIVPSADRLGVVRLRAGEVASVHVSHASDLEQALKAALAGEIELVVEYEVSDGWGKRFGVVAGKVRGTATVPK